MKIKWYPDAQKEYRRILLFYKTKVGTKYAKELNRKISGSIRHLANFPEMGVLREDTRIGKCGFRVLFIEQYVCIYKVQNNAVLIYYFADARSNYLSNFLG